MPRRATHDDTEVRECLAKAFGVSRKPNYRDGAIFELNEALAGLRFEPKLTTERIEEILNDE